MTRSTASVPAPPAAAIAPDYDVVVVGARAAGASTAMLLARRGLSVLAIDRGAYGSDTLSTHSLAGAGVLQLSRWGLLDTIRSAGTPVANRVVFRYGDDTVGMDVPPRGDVDGLYSPRRTLLDATLVDAAVEAGVDVRHGTTLVSVTTDGVGRVDGVELEVDGRRRRVSARLVIGADGIRSRVARQVGAELLHRESVGATSIFAYFSGLPSDTIINFYSPERVVGAIPTNDGLACVWVGMPIDRFERRARGRLPEAHAAEVASIPELVAIHGAEPVSGFRSFPGSPGFLRRAWGPGWALVGDAGYFKDPLSAHGITDAFICAELLADAVAATISGGVEEADALGGYQRTRDEMAAMMMPPVATVASFPGDMAVVQQGFREMSRAMRHEVNLIESTSGALATV
jgi:flavin-dependent dehydrogenase